MLAELCLAPCTFRYASKAAFGHYYDSTPFKFMSSSAIPESSKQRMNLSARFAFQNAMSTAVSSALHGVTFAASLKSCDVQEAWPSHVDFDSHCVLNFGVDFVWTPKRFSKACVAAWLALIQGAPPREFLHKEERALNAAGTMGSAASFESAVLRWKHDSKVKCSSAAEAKACADSAKADAEIITLFEAYGEFFESADEAIRFMELMLRHMPQTISVSVPPDMQAEFGFPEMHVLLVVPFRIQAHFFCRETPAATFADAAPAAPLADVLSHQVHGVPSLETYNAPSLETNDVPSFETNDFPSLEVCDSKSVVFDDDGDVACLGSNVEPETNPADAPSTTTDDSKFLHVFKNTAASGRKSRRAVKVQHVQNATNGSSTRSGLLTKRRRDASVSKSVAAAANAKAKPASIAPPFRIVFKHAQKPQHMKTADVAKIVADAVAHFGIKTFAKAK